MFPLYHALLTAIDCGMNYNLVLRPTLKLRDAHDSWLSRSGHPELDTSSHFIAPFVPRIALKRQETCNDDRVHLYRASITQITRL